MVRRTWSAIRMDMDIMPDSTIYFSKYYVCFKGVRDGWIEGCRKVICVDGCFLKGLCKGELLAVVGRDTNNNIYHIVWVVVNVENKVNWKWFLDILVDDIGGGNGNGLTIISDGHKGLLEAVKERISEAEHRQCVRHVYANFKKKFDGEHYRKLFWVVVNSTIVPQFKEDTDGIKKLDPNA
uniref:MULE transposase domain-containing protein n=1 Tax=Lactuca sativa TaxID=4236 RepID=A0A9R1WAZ9_LACSA|nr:hypothetical protein LSAT_V11C200067840 [Lactuca sativa]